MTRITIIDGHPDPAPQRFVHSLADAYAGSAEKAGHQVRRIVLADSDFPLLRSAREWQEGRPCSTIIGAQDDICWAEHIVILYPLWLGGVPALLKGFSNKWHGPALPSLRRKRIAVEAAERTSGTDHRHDGNDRPVLPACVSCSQPGTQRACIPGFAPFRHSVIGRVESSDAYRRKCLKRIPDARLPALALAPR